MANFSALYDACVLYPAPVRDLLMHLALTDLFRAKWTNKIHEEWIENLLKERQDLTRERLERTRDMMNSHVRDCLIENYEDLIEGLSLPDPNDRHVLAAAIKGQCDVIVTYNLKDFPPEKLSVYGIEAQHPDVFTTHLIDLSPGVVCASVARHRQSLTKPCKTVEEYLATLEQQSLPMLVRHLKSYFELL